MEKSTVCPLKQIFPLLLLLVALICSNLAGAHAGEAYPESNSEQQARHHGGKATSSTSYSTDKSAFGNAFKNDYRSLQATLPRTTRFSSSSLNTNSTNTHSDYLSEIQADGFYCWSSLQLPVKVYFEPGEQVPGFKNKFVDCLAACFDEWAAASHGKIAWVEVAEPDQANITVRWTDKVTERAEGTEAGRTKTFASLNTATNRGIINGAEMLLLTRLPNRDFTAAETKRAYLHEVGHALGIAGHSHNPNDIMYYAVTEHASSHLDDRDKATINRLYRG